MRHPVREQNRFVFREVAFVEYKEKLGTIGVQSLNGVRNPGGKIPEIAFGYIGDEALAVEINRRDARVSVKHQGPLGSGVPMQFTDASGCQPHIDTRNRFRYGEFANRDLPRPSPVLHPFVREPEGVLKRLHSTCISGWRQEGVGILGVNCGIAPSAPIALARIRLLFLSGCVPCRQHSGSH